MTDNTELPVADGSSTSEPIGATPPAEDGGDKIRASMAKVFDNIERSEEEARPQKEWESPSLPPAVKSLSLTEAFERTAEWMDKPVEERRTESAVSKEIEARRDEADKHGISLSEHSQIEQNLRVREAGEMAPVINTARELFPNEAPTESVGNIPAAAKYIQQDPVEGLKWLAGQLGVDWHRLAIEQAPAPDYVLGAIDAFFESETDPAVRDRAMQVLQDPAFERTGNPQRDLAKAHREARKPRSKPKKPTWEQTIRSVGERIA